MFLSRLSQSIGDRKPFLSDSQWNLIKDLFPSPPKSPKGGPTPITSRDCLEGILWILKSGDRWKRFTREASLFYNVLATPCDVVSNGSDHNSVGSIAPPDEWAKEAKLVGGVW